VYDIEKTSGEEKEYYGAYKVLLYDMSSNEKDFYYASWFDLGALKLNCHKHLKIISA